MSGVTRSQLLVVSVIPWGHEWGSPGHSYWWFLLFRGAMSGVTRSQLLVISVIPWGHEWGHQVTATGGFCYSVGP